MNRVVLMVMMAWAMVGVSCVTGREREYELKPFEQRGVMEYEAIGLVVDLPAVRRRIDPQVRVIVSDSQLYVSNTNMRSIAIRLFPVGRFRHPEPFYLAVVAIDRLDVEAIELYERGEHSLAHYRGEGKLYMDEIRELSDHNKMHGPQQAMILRRDIKLSDGGMAFISASLMDPLPEEHVEAVKRIMDSVREADGQSLDP